VALVPICLRLRLVQNVNDLARYVFIVVEAVHKDDIIFYTSIKLALSRDRIYIMLFISIICVRSFCIVGARN